MKKPKLGPEDLAWAKVKFNWSPVVRKTLKLPLIELPMERKARLQSLETSLWCEDITGDRPTVHNFVNTCRIHRCVITSSCPGAGEHTIKRINQALKKLGTSLPQLISATNTSQID